MLKQFSASEKIVETASQIFQEAQHRVIRMEASAQAACNRDVSLAYPRIRRVESAAETLAAATAARMREKAQSFFYELARARDQSE